MSLISAQNLSVRLNGKQILTHIDITINAGEIITIIGPNGSGKTTFLRALIGAIPYSTGHVKHANGLRIGYVPQRLHIDHSLPINVSRFVTLGQKVEPNRMYHALDRVGATGLQHHSMMDLSGGQFQRVLLARALLSDPQLLILDEATQGLDQPGAAQFYKLLGELRDTLNCAILMVSHELHVVMAAADRVICINGHICCQGTPKHVAMADEYRALFGTGTQGALALYRHKHDHHHNTHAGEQ